MATKPLDKAEYWGTWQGPAGKQATQAYNEAGVVPPDPRFTSSIRMKRFKNDQSQYIASDYGRLSRAQLSGSYPTVVGTDMPLIWTEWWVKFNSLAQRTSDDFHMYIEAHTPSANPGGVWTGNLSGDPTDEMLRYWIGPGEWTHDYKGRKPVVLGEWNHYLVGYKPSIGTDGEIHFYRNGELVFERVGYKSSTQAGRHYPEIGFYTYWNVEGTDDMNIVVMAHTEKPAFPDFGGGGEVPADCSECQSQLAASQAQVASLQAANAQLTQEKAALQTKVNNAKAALA